MLDEQQQQQQLVEQEQEPQLLTSNNNINNSQNNISTTTHQQQQQEIDYNQSTTTTTKTQQNTKRLQKQLRNENNYQVRNTNKNNEVAAKVSTEPKTQIPAEKSCIQSFGGGFQLLHQQCALLVPKLVKRAQDRAFFKKKTDSCRKIVV